MKTDTLDISDRKKQEQNMCLEVKPGRMKSINEKKKRNLDQQ